MRFYHAPKPQDGEVRHRSFFALRPITIDCETRWLEFVVVEERFHKGESPWSEDRWEPVRFIDSPLEVTPTQQG